MMNKQKSSKAWRWTAAAFVPMLALLLMAFGRTGESSSPESFGSPTLVPELKQDSVKQWSVSDFKTMNFSKSKIEKYSFKVLPILMNAQSKLLIDNNPAVMEDVPNYIRKIRDYSSADEKTKLYFKKLVINGKEKMAANSIIIFIAKDLASSPAEFQKLMNAVGNTILEIRGKYANEVFGNSYSKIDSVQRNLIDQLIPFEASIAVPDKQVKLKSPPSPPPFLIEIRKDSVFVNDKFSSLEELSKKVESWQKINPNGIVNLKAEAEVPLTRINEVKDVLRNAKVQHINYSAHK